MLSWEKQIYRKQGFRGIVLYLIKAFLLGILWPGAILWVLLDKKGCLKWLTNGVVFNGDNNDN
ncbi:hypothetical protein ES705_01648 [subsurface metagenome]